jgi:hypothetical protein
MRKPDMNKIMDHPIIELGVVILLMIAIMGPV